MANRGRDGSSSQFVVKNLDMGKKALGLVGDAAPFFQLSQPTVGPGTVGKGRPTSTSLRLQ